jgi:hypothetical protein
MSIKIVARDWPGRHRWDAAEPAFRDQYVADNVFLTKLLTQCIGEFVLGVAGGETSRIGGEEVFVAVYVDGEDGKVEGVACFPFFVRKADNFFDSPRRGAGSWPRRRYGASRSPRPETARDLSYNALSTWRRVSPHPGLRPRSRRATLCA